MIYALFRYRWKNIMHQPLLFLMVMFFPYILLGMIGFGLSHFFQQQTENIGVAVIDQDQTMETKALLSQLSKEGALGESLSIISMGDRQAMKAMEDGEITAIVTIPEGFTGDLRSGTNTPIEVMNSSQYPLSSSMVTILLESGARYISAAQSGVNTVYHLHIKELASKEERSKLLQQVIIQFTLFALNRNQLFETEEIHQGSSIGWKYHGVIAFLVTGFLLSSIIFSMVSKEKMDQTIQERLRSMDVRTSVLIISQFFLYVSFFTIQLVLAAFLLSVFLSMDWLFSFPAMFTYAGFVLFTASMLSLTDSMFGNRSAGSALLAAVFGLGCLVSGVWVPAVYLPEWMPAISQYVPFYWFYHSFETILTASGWPIVEWSCMMVLAVMILIMALVAGKIKEGKHDSISFPSP